MRYGPGIQHFPPHEVPPEPNYLPPATCHASPRHSIASIHSHSVPSHPLSFHLKIRLPASCGSPIVIASSCQTRSVASRSSLRTTYRWSRILFSGEHSSTLGSLRTRDDDAPSARVANLYYSPRLASAQGGHLCHAIIEQFSSCLSHPIVLKPLVTRYEYPSVPLTLSRLRLRLGMANPSRTLDDSEVTQSAVTAWTNNHVCHTTFITLIRSLCPPSHLRRCAQFRGSCAWGPKHSTWGPGFTHVFFHF